MKKQMICLNGLAVVILMLAYLPSAEAGAARKVKNTGESIVYTREELGRTSNRIKYKVAKMRGKIFGKTITMNPISGEWGTSQTCEDPKSLTCRKGKDHYANCMHQSKNYYYRLVAAELEKKLSSPANFSESKIKELQEDLESVKKAIQTGVVVDADPQKPKRWMFHLTNAERAEINRLNSVYIQEVYRDCEARFGVMGRYR